MAAADGTGQPLGADQRNLKRIRYRRGQIIGLLRDIVVAVGMPLRYGVKFILKLDIHTRGMHSVGINLG
jgi:hypothetical protein